MMLPPNTVFIYTVHIYSSRELRIIQALDDGYKLAKMHRLEKATGTLCGKGGGEIGYGCLRKS
jgi:hypothetical protein